MGNTEIWREIPDTDYSVSNLGRIASRKFGNWRVLRPARNSNGYLCVCLYSGSGQRSVTVHSLVAGAFLVPKPTPKHEVNHKNGVRDDPRDCNLEWVTRSQNVRHGFEILGNVGIRGEGNKWTKMTEIGVREIRRRWTAGEKLKTIADDYGIDPSNVGNIVHGKSWAWLR